MVFIDKITVYYDYSGPLHHVEITIPPGSVQRCAFIKYMKKLDVFDLYVHRFNDFWNLVEEKC